MFHGEVARDLTEESFTFWSIFEAELITRDIRSDIITLTKQDPSMILFYKRELNYII